MTKNTAAIIAVLFSIATILVALWSYRSAFLTPYDTSYTQDLYDHSQWTIARSIRSIGDELLYQIAGHELVTTGKYFSINPEVPPLGKYLYGWGIVWWQNARIMSLILFFVATTLTWIVLSLLFKEQYMRSFAFLIFLLNPLVLHQMSVSMLDLPHLVALLMHIIGMLLLIRATNTRTGILAFLLAGVGLGAFMAIKIGFFVVPIIIADVYLLWQSKKPLSVLLGIAGTAGLSYIATFAPYFMQGNSFMSFLKAEKWTLHFYLSSQAQPFYPAPLTALLMGLNRSWSGGQLWSSIDEWTLLWPLMLLFLGISCILWKSLTVLMRYVTFLTLGLILATALVPFFARYLLLVMPFLAILTTFHSVKRNYHYAVTGIVLGIISIQTLLYLFPTPHRFTRNIVEPWQNGAYQDMYPSLTDADKKVMSQKQFWLTAKAFERKLALLDKTVAIQPTYAFPWQSEASSTVTITYHTPIGSVTHSAPLSLIREQNVWHIDWSNEYLFSRFDDIAAITLEEKNGMYGSVVSKDQKRVYAQPMLRTFISVVPADMKNENAMQETITQLTGIKKYSQERLYKANHPADWQADIGFILPVVNESQIDTRALDPAIRLSERPSIGINAEQILPVQRKRIQNSILEKEYVLQPAPGGSLMITYVDGTKKILIQRKPKNGQDVIVTY
ncbi:MAG: hypothetical protein NUV52_03705 [Candidatus Roizmanbacteria bacterium]|nr:hypothetical protein [Candidatus Roizmanbacteria bacterium]